MFSDLRFRLRAIFRRDSMERELEDELGFHFEQQVEELKQSGLSSEEASRRARIIVGGSERLKEECRDARGVSLLETMLQDLRYGARVLRRSPGFTMVAVLSLAIGIGANTAIFSVVNAVLLRTLPVRAPQDLAIAYSSTDSPVKGIWRRNSNDTKDPATGRQLSNTFPLTALREFRARTSEAVEAFAFYSPGRIGVGDGAGNRPAHATLVSGNFFEGLGVPMALGRGLLDHDDQPGTTAVVVTYSFWERSLKSDASILGKELTLNGVSMTVVGVTGPGFHGISAAGFDGPAAVFAPLSALETILPGELRSGKPKTAPDYWWLQIMARRKPGITPEAAAEQLTAVFQGTLANSGVPALRDAKNPRIILRPGNKGLDSLREKIQRPLLILLGVVGVVLLLACINVATLQVARSAARQREMAVRLSLGASRGRIMRQLIVESLLLSALGALVGVLLAAWGAAVVARLLTVTYDNVALNLSPDIRVLGFTLLASILTGVLFGLSPALRAARVDIAPNLKQNQRNSTRLTSFRLGNLLITAQVTLSLVLLVGSGLFLRTLANLNRMDAGFDRDNLLLFRLDLGQLGYKAEQVGPPYDRVLESIRATPGVTSAAAMSHPLISGWHNGTRLSSPETEWRPIDVWMNTVSPDFFETLGIPLVAGRSFSPRDTESAPRVAILNQAAAHRLFGGRPAVGQILRRHAGGGTFQVEVVGVAGDAKYDSLRKGIEPTVFIPYRQDLSLFTRRAFAVRTSVDPPTMIGPIRQVISVIDRDLVMMDVKTQARLVEESLHQERLFATLLTSFGCFALLLAAVGLHGVTAYSTARRTAEIGLRMALGAERNQMLGLILRQALRPVAIGAALGFAASWAASRWIESLLFGVQRMDPPTFAVVFFLLIAVALAAAFVPASRAAHVDPMTALRAE